MEYNFSITKNTNPKKKPDPKNLPFGTVFTDHMFIMDYNEEKAGTTAASFHMLLSSSILPQSYFTTDRKCLKASKHIRRHLERYSFSDLI